MREMFKITRTDGRSNTDVVLDLFADCTAGDVVTYETLAECLSDGTETVYTRKGIQGIVKQSLPRLLREQTKALANVLNVGYRVVPAAQHMILASGRKEKADRQMELGLLTLQHVDWSAMDMQQRRAHEGQLLVLSSLHQQMQALALRQNKVEDLLRTLRT